MKPRPFPPVHPHGDLQQVFPNVYRVTGSIKIGPMRISRNMVVLKEGDRLILVNTLRLDDARLEALDALGMVTDTVRLAGFHGSDDAFYQDRYGCTAHAVRGQTYFPGTNPKAEPYFEPDAWIDADTPPPIEGASLYVFSCSPPEGILRIPAEGGTLISGDSLQHWATTDAYFNIPARLGMRVLGFIKPYALGKGWIQQIKPDKNEVRGILDLDFANVVPCHGEPVIGGARDKYRPAIEAFAGA